MSFVGLQKETSPASWIYFCLEYKRLGIRNIANGNRLYKPWPPKCEGVILGASISVGWRSCGIVLENLCEKFPGLSLPSAGHVYPERGNGQVSVGENRRVATAQYSYHGQELFLSTFPAVWIPKGGPVFITVHHALLIFLNGIRCILKYWNINYILVCEESWEKWY
jgi:hypothetical protein